MRAFKTACTVREPHAMGALCVTAAAGQRWRLSLSALHGLHPRPQPAVASCAVWLHLQRTAPLLPQLRVWMPGLACCVRGAMVWWVFALCLNEVLQRSCSACQPRS